MYQHLENEARNEANKNINELYKLCKLPKPEFKNLMREVISCLERNDGGYYAYAHDELYMLLPQMAPYAITADGGFAIGMQVSESVYCLAACLGISFK